MRATQIAMQLLTLPKPSKTCQSSTRMRPTGKRVAYRLMAHPKWMPLAQGSSFMVQLRQRLLDDHVELAKQLRRLADSVDANDSCSDLGQIWAGLESHLLDHLDAEERYLFPMAAREHRAEIEALRAEHQHIRRAVAELGVCVDLHTLRKAAIVDLIEFLQRHAEREDRSLYEWCERQSGGHGVTGLFAMFERHPRREGSEHESSVS